MPIAIYHYKDEFEVTILILIDGFLQYMLVDALRTLNYRHNPYFNRWFSAIRFTGKIVKNSISHNPYFNRWFSAISG